MVLVRSVAVEIRGPNSEPYGKDWRDVGLADRAMERVQIRCRQRLHAVDEIALRPTNFGASGDPAAATCRQHQPEYPSLMIDRIIRRW